MDSGPAGVDGAGPRTPGARGSRRLLVAGTAAVVVLIAVIAVLATRLADTPPTADAAPPPRPDLHRIDRAGHLPAARAVRGDRPCRSRTGDWRHRGRRRHDPDRETCH